MQSLTASKTLRCFWYHVPEHDCQYELRSGSEAYALYDGLTDVPTCRTAEGVWIFQKSGLWKPQTHVRRAEVGEDVAIILWKALHPTLELPDGRRFDWHYNFLQTAFTIKDKSGNDLIAFTSLQGASRQQPHYSEATMEFKVQAEALPDSALLSLIGWYTILPALANPVGGDINAMS